MRRRSKEGVSEIIGTILTVAITVILFSGIALYVGTIPQPKGSTAASFAGQSTYSESNSRTYINITQMGGQALGHYDAHVVLTVNDRQVGPLTMQEGGVTGDWTTGVVWSTMIVGTSRTDTIHAVVYLASTGDVVWQSTISDLSPSNTPIITSRGIWDLYGVYNSPIYSGTPVHFYARFAAMQAISNLVPDSVKVDARIIGLGSDIQLVQSSTDMYFFESTDNVQAALSWSGKSVTFYFDYYTTDTHSQTERVYISTMLQVLKNPNGNGNGNGTSGNPPQNINYSALQGFNIFKKTDWDANEYNATPTTVFANDEKAVVVVASQYLVNILGQNDLEIRDSGTGLVNYLVSSPANTFSVYAYYAGNYIYIATVDFSKVDPDRYYSVSMGLKDTWNPQHSMYATAQVRVGGTTQQIYPVFETYSDPGYTTQSDSFTMNDKIYVQIKTQHGYSWDAYGGSVMIKDFFGNMQINRAPALPQDESGYAYSVSGGKATITGYTGSATDLIIPTTLGGYPVTAIGDNAFKSKTAIQSVIIPETVTSIGASAFYGCTGMDWINIGVNVTTIGNSAFYGCSDLSLLNFLGSVAPTSVGSNWITGTSSTVRGASLATSDFLPNSDSDNRWHSLRMGVLMPLDKNPVSTVKQLTGASVNTYRFVIDLSLAGQKPWISGQNHYTLSYDTFKTGASGSTEQYYLAKVIYVAGPIQTLDIVTSGKSTGDHHRHLSDSNNAVQYYLNDEDWGDPYTVATYIASDPHHSWNSPQGSEAAIGDMNGDGTADIVAVVYDNYERRDSETTLNIYYNDGSGGWSRSIIGYLPYQAVPTALTLGNADLDGDLDIFVAYSFPVGTHHWNALAIASVGVYINDGAWTYEEICNSATSIYYMAVGDLDLNQGANIPDCSMDVLVGFDRSGLGTVSGSFIVYKNTNYMGHDWTAVGITFSDGSTPKEARGVLIDNLDSTWKNEFVLLDKWGQAYLGNYDASAGTATAAKIPSTAASSDPTLANTVGYGLGTGVIIGKRGERLRDIVITVSSWTKVSGWGWNNVYKTTFDIKVLDQISLFTFSKVELSDQYFYFADGKHWTRERNNPTNTVAADVDGNGLTDLVLCGSDGEIRLLYNLRGTSADASWNMVQVDQGSEGTGWTTNELVTSVSVGNLHGGTVVGPIVVPGTPDLNVTTANTAATLTWTGPAIDGGSPITGYKIYISSDGGHTYTSTIVTPVTMTYTYTGLTNYQKYWFKVSAINAMGEGAATVVSATPAPTAPGAPTGLTATRGNGQVSLTWTAPGDNGGQAIDYYVVYQNGAALATHPAATSMVISGLTNGVSYTFTVAAHNSVGIGDQSGGATATPATLPGQPTNVVATPGKSGNSRWVDLTWSAPISNGGSAITGYKIYYNWNSGTSTFSSSVTVSSATFSWEQSGLSKNTQYRYMICAVNELGESAGVTMIASTSG